MSNTIELWEVNKLINKHFFIPTYQRGYRWETQQVEDLLNDLYEFKNNADTNAGQFYCLQPIVVKKRGGLFDVIDGQQRLTTILIILKYLQDRLKFSIEYATREGSKEFLDDISKSVKEESEERNIDFFFMKNAYLKVEEWFQRTTEINEEYSLETEMTTYLLKHCKVIWYEVNEDVDAESVFTRLNIGKIPLTNAELIKALLLRKSNQSGGNKITQLKKMEIASEWDRIENTLRDDKVWLFINHPYIKQPEVRIEYIFDLINHDSNKRGEFATFYYFNERLKESDYDVDDIWAEIKEYFQTIMEWYHNPEWYHLIGFITATNLDTIENLIHEYRKNEYTKQEFMDHIKDMIRDRISQIDDIDDLEYGLDDEDINTILLLFNVLTVMKTNDTYTRFRFDEYKKNQWSLEHIHAQNAEGILNSKETMLAWIDEHIASFKSFTEESDKYKEVIDMLEGFDRKHITMDSFSKLFESISKKIESDYGSDLNKISNLALLDRNTNSSLSNSFFDVKRRKIVDKDKKGEFVPVCTRNVFLKYYSKDASQIHYWSNADRTDYLSAIKDVLSDYIAEER